jgi:hypothetical protein
MQGGRFAGSITSATNDFDTIVDIKDAPAEGQWTELAVPAERSRAYRFVKYMAKNDIWADIAEIEFYAGDRKLGGTPFGTTGRMKPPTTRNWPLTATRKPSFAAPAVSASMSVSTWG